MRGTFKKVLDCTLITTGILPRFLGKKIRIKRLLYLLKKVGVLSV